MPTKAVTDASFAADVLGSSKPVLVDFWADWCGRGGRGIFCPLLTASLSRVAFPFRLHRSVRPALARNLRHPRL